MRFLARIAVVGASLVLTLPTRGEPSLRLLRVCSDPNNLPFSHRDRTGFENRLADLLADELGAEVRYTWWAQRRGFVRNTLKSKRCDVIMGIPSGFEAALTTRPYYRSSYVFVSQRARALKLRSLDDPRLRKLRIGVPLVGDDYANPPAVHALARRGLIDNVVGFSVYGDYREESPPQALLHAVARGEIDVAIAWGPLAGDFRRRSETPLEITPLRPSTDGPYPFVFDISLAVRHSERALKEELERALEARRDEIDALLAEHQFPLVD